MSKGRPDETGSMKQHTTGGLKSENADVAAWEAGKGAVIGASKVRISQASEQARRKTNWLFLTVGSCIWGTWRRWIRSISSISRSHHTIQGVSCLFSKSGSRANIYRFIQMSGE
jgi:hypothetical protein